MKKKKNPQVELYIYNFDKKTDGQLKPAAEIEQVAEKYVEEYGLQTKKSKGKRRQRPKYTSKGEVRVVKDESDPDYVRKSAEQWWRLLRAAAHRDPKPRDWHQLRVDPYRR